MTSRPPVPTTSPPGIFKLRGQAKSRQKWVGEICVSEYWVYPEVLMKVFFVRKRFRSTLKTRILWFCGQRKMRSYAKYEEKAASPKSVFLVFFFTNEIYLRVSGP